MNIVIKDWEIKPYDMGWQLGQWGVTKKGESIYKNITYHATPLQALQVLYRRFEREGEQQVTCDLKTAVQALQRLEQGFLEALKDATKDIKRE